MDTPETPTRDTIPSRSYAVDAVRFRVVREAAARSRRYVMSGPAEAATFARQTPTFAHEDAREHFAVAMLDSKNGVVAWHEVSMGTLSASLVHPREIFGPALRTLGVASVLLFHNHPSGDTTPSLEDLRLTRELAEAGKLLQIPVHDHVILGDGGDAYVSLASRGAL